MTETKFIKYLESLKLLEKSGKGVLELGCGKGMEALALAERGFDVTAIDKNPDVFKENKQIAVEKKLSLKFLIQDILDFSIKPKGYYLIIARNVLPFLEDKRIIFKTLESMIGGLEDGGIIYFTLFGFDEPWVKENKAVGLEYQEVIDFLNQFNLELILRETKEGLMTKMSGEFKYWQVFEFIYRKKA